MEILSKKVLIDLGKALADLTMKETAHAIQKRILLAKEIKNTETLRITYDDLIKELLDERQEALKIATLYKSQFDDSIIPDSSLEELHGFLVRFIDIFRMKKMASTQEKNDMEAEVICELFSFENLKALQLIGFSYKDAIGIPLTRLCSQTILSLSKKTKSYRAKPR